MATLSCLLVVLLFALALGRTPPCVTVQSGAQQLLLEPYGANGIRVRALPNMAAKFRDDLVSALIKPSDGIFATGPCVDGQNCKSGVGDLN